MIRKRVAVIGCGISGLVGIKACKEEDFHVECYERTDNFGGIWRYRDTEKEGVPSVAWSTIINSSKEMSAFSDFPPPKEFPNYMHHSMMIKYVQMYAEHFDLIRHIKFLHEVLSVTKTEEYQETGQWKVTVRDVKTETVEQKIFDAVMVCAGHHIYPIIPQYTGMEDFKGRVIHTHSYKRSTAFENKSVLIIGVGNSGVDAACEIGTVATKVYLSTRRGTWVLNRIGPRGRPSDTYYNMRFVNFGRWILPSSVFASVLEQVTNHRFDHSLYNLKPKHRITGQHPTISDDLPNRIISGRVVVKKDVRYFTKTGVVFQNEDSEYPIDAVVLATGYHIQFPFLEQEVFPTENNEVRLYKFVFPPDIDPPTLAFVGLIQTVGAIFIAAEMQARWVAQVWSGQQTLPSHKDMLSELEATSKGIAKRYYKGERNTLQADWIPYLDDICNMFGAKPNFLRLFFTDPKLFWACMTGPSVSYQYRLSGPHSWSGAREAILTATKRIDAPLESGQISEQATLGVLRRIPRLVYNVMVGVICYAFFLVIMVTA